MIAPCTAPCPALLAVPHEGTNKFVGKIVRHIEYGPVFFHAHLPSQRHRQTNCPAPLDRELLERLAAWEVALIYDEEHPEKERTKGTVTLRRIMVAEALNAPSALYEGRYRHYPPEEWWTATPATVARQKGEYVIRVGGKALFVEPRLPERETIVIRPEAF